MFADLSDEQLVHRALQLERDLVTVRFKHSMSQLANTSEVRNIRREIAQLRTEARARELKAGLAKNALLANHRGSFAPAAKGGAAAPAEKGGFLSGIVDKLTGKE